MKLITVNVIETIDSIPKQILSFKEDTEGNTEAEALFTTMAKENSAMDADMNTYLEEGIYTSGNYNVCLIHSS